MGISIWQLVILLAVVILLFGTKKLRNLGGDLGSAIKSFKTAIKDDSANVAAASQEPPPVATAKLPDGWLQKPLTHRQPR